MDDKIRISIKGDEAASRAAMGERGVRAELVAGGRSQSSWDARPSDLPKIVTWYCEPGVCAEGTGFPDGTLLYYR